MSVWVWPAEGHRDKKGLSTTDEFELSPWSCLGRFTCAHVFLPPVVQRGRYCCGPQLTVGETEAQRG